ncbi:MAG: hypothetical protein JST01_14495 [Cyanobacteria bacterium SZAS TMP-1]|nr:hypothetical protein [Cyanobacteria bacterium SZAS TMP-1]
MARGNTIILNVSGGEVSPDLYARLDLPVYQRGMQRIQNYIVQPQGGLNYRTALQHVKAVRGNLTGRLLTFTFSEQDTYVLEFTDRKIRFYRNFAAVLDSRQTGTATAITKANPGRVTYTGVLGLQAGQEIFITGVKGMKEIDGQFFTVGDPFGGSEFDLLNAYGENVDTTAFNTYVSGGTINRVYEIDSPYKIEHIPDLHVKQSADTIYITHQKYAPYKLSRKDHDDWTITVFDRTGQDPFKQVKINSITVASPGVFTSAVAHGFKVGDEIYTDDLGADSNLFLKRQWWKIDTVPTTTQFTIKDPATGTVYNNLIAYNTTDKPMRVISTQYCPKTLAFLDMVRLAYGNWLANPAGLAFSSAPDSTTGDTKFDDFTVGADATNAMLFTLPPIFDKMESIQWIATVNRHLVVGGLSSVRRIHGQTVDDPISPSSINAKPINSIGSTPIQPYSSGQSVFYVDGTSRRVHVFLFTFESSDYVTVNQHLTARQLGFSPFVTLAQQRGDSGLLWVLRKDGVLTGLTFNELESIYGWHRHYIGGKSVVDGVKRDRAKVLSIAVEPRLGAESVLWAIVERTIGSKTYRSVEYLNQPVNFVEPEDFFSGDGYEARDSDLARYESAMTEQLKDSVHVDSAVSYDGSALSTTITMTPSDTTGDAITITASAAFFDDSMVNKEIWKKYDVLGGGGGRAQITGVISTTQALVKVLKDFDSTDAIPAGNWFLTTAKVYGLLNKIGETLTLQLDGAPGGTATVNFDGSIDLPGQCSKVHAGYGYLGLATTMNLDLAGDRGASEARIRKIRQVLARFQNTVGARIGTTLWDTEQATFKSMDDVTDRATPPYNGIHEMRPSDSWSRQTKQVVVMQDIPSPQNLLSLDIELEIADE